jgi:hypothetical protein
MTFPTQLYRHFDADGRLLYVGIWVFALTFGAQAAYAENWTMHCHNAAVDGDEYDVSWHEDEGALYLVDPAKPPVKRWVNVWNSRQGWAGTKALAIVHFPNGSQLEAYFENSGALSADMQEGGSHMRYTSAVGDVLARDSCIVTKRW